MRENTLVLTVLVFSAGFCLAACPSADLTGDCFVDFNDFAMMASGGNFLDLHTLALQWLETNDEPLTILGRVDTQTDDPDSFAVEYVVVDKQRVDRTIFQYECEVILTNLSATAFENVQLVMVDWPDKITTTYWRVRFGDAEIEPGESASSIDTCTFRVDRSEPIDPVEIIWHHIAEPRDMVWVYIDDPGVPGHEGFNGYMSKYETTNAQYCQFLNAALASGDITVRADNMVYGARGSIPGSYSTAKYFHTYPADSDSQITYSNGTFSVRTRDGYSMANHPVVEVSWNGARDFCSYYGYRLPTELEWQAVADFDGSYTYACGTTIDQNKANYDDANPLRLSSKPYTSPVDYYPSYGYGMNDMAGNVWEWTNTLSGSYRILRGGSWTGGDNHCTVSHRLNSYQRFTSGYKGFRVCR